MKFLFIDLASRDGMIAAVTEDTVVASEKVSNRISDGEIIPIVESVLGTASWNLKDITHIACVIGPGGFTSLRVAVTFVNVLADQLGIPSAGIHLSELYTSRSSPLPLGEGLGEGAIYWMHSTKKDQLFVCGGKWEEPTLITLHDIPCGLWMGELLEEHEKALGAERAPLTPLCDILPNIVNLAEYSNEILRPWYGRGW